MLVASLALVATGAYAQKASVKAAEKLAKEKPAEARRLATEARNHEETKNDPYAWYVSGEIEEQAFQREFIKVQMGQQANETEMYNALINEVPFFLKTYELENVPDAKGKIKLKYAKKAKDYLRSNLNYLVNAGYHFLQQTDKVEKSAKQQLFKKGAEAFVTYLDLRESPLLAEDKSLHTPQQDTLAWDAAYLATAASYEAKLYDETIALAQRFKNQEHKRNDIAQFLYGSYLAKGDSTSAVAVLEEGVKNFPKDIFYLGNLVNLYSGRGEIDKAIELLKQGIANDPKNLPFKTALANMYESQEKFDEAFALHKEIYDADKTTFEANYNLGRALFNKAIPYYNADKPDKLTMAKAKELFEQSLPYLQKAYELDADKAWYQLSRVYYALGQEDKQKELEAKHQ